MVRLSLIIFATLSLIACVRTETLTVSNNPVSVPTELSSTENSETNETNETDDLLLKKFRAIDASITRGNYAAAQQNLNQLSTIAMTRSLYRINFILLQSKLGLLAGNPQQTLTFLDQLSPLDELNDAQQHYISLLRAQAFYRTNHVLLSTITTIKSMDPNNVAASQQIWHDLLTINPTKLQTTETQPLIAGWFSLAQIAQENANNLVALQQNLRTWQQKYPQHPANQLLYPAAYTELIHENQDQEKSIAVILPLSGNYAALGKDIQNGILSAYYVTAEVLRPMIYFYDSNAEKMSDIYANIKVNNNTLILGPLIKENVKKLLGHAEDNPQIISLNYTSEKMPITHIEFGLSPENEAKQTAQLAWRLGKNRALVIAPKTEKGKKNADAFMQQWAILGGQVVDAYYFTSDQDFSKSIATFLGVAGSRVRQHLLHEMLKTPVNSNTYFRHDADMIFLAAEAKDGRQIYPFINFYSGNYFSVFATSTIYSGFTNPNKDKDLNDVYFCDIPGLFQEKHQERLDLLGQDAYLLAMQQQHLHSLPELPLMGATGQLTVNIQGKIQRELVCAQFKNGIPTRLN